MWKRAKFEKQETVLSYLCFTRILSRYRRIHPTSYSPLQNTSMIAEMDEEHLQFLRRIFQDNLQEALNSQTAMFLTSVNDYIRYCNFGVRNVSDSKDDSTCATSENMYRLKQELGEAKAQLENAQALISQLESLISILRGALKTSQEVTENFINE